MPIPTSDIFKQDANLDEMAENAKLATAFLKAVAHEARLMILCYLASGEKSVTELEELLSLRQPAVSQQLARLRSDNIISARRDGKAIYYRISDERSRRMMEIVYELFCSPSTSEEQLNVE